MTLGTFLELLAGGGCTCAGMVIAAWLVNHGEQRRHDRGECRHPHSGRC